VATDARATDEFMGNLSLLSNWANEMMRASEIERPFSSRAQPRSLRDDAMERGLVLRRF
jgi:hypothetical protein